MTDAEIENYLSANGYPEHIVREGRPGLARRWREFVGEVERGYTLNLEDYRNDLDVRGIIALAGAEDDEIRALDARFQKLLISTGVRVWESAASDHGVAPFWDFGYPANAGVELMRDLREEGLA